MEKESFLYVSVRFAGLAVITALMLPAAVLLGISGALWKLLDNILERLKGDKSYEESC